MSIQLPPDQDLEACVDVLEDFIATQPQFAAPVLAYALRLHLGALLRVMLDDGQCSRIQLREFVAGLEREASGERDS